MKLEKANQRSAEYAGTDSPFEDLTGPAAELSLATAPPPLFTLESDPPRGLTDSPVIAPRYEPSQGPSYPRPFLTAMGVLPSQPVPLDSPRIEAELHQIMALINDTTDHDIEKLTERWNRAPSIPWNEIARELVARYSMNPPEASRLYALMSIAQYDATILTQRAKEEFNRPAPAELVSKLPLLTPFEAGSAYPSHHGAVAAASKEVLVDAFPDAAPQLEELFYQHLTTRLISGVSLPSDLTEGVQLGHHVARELRSYTERSPKPTEAFERTNQLPGGWYDDGRGALHPHWGELEPLLMAHPAQFRPAPPPDQDSDLFRSALDEVRALCRDRTAAQRAVVEHWADGPGTATPPGHWNAIACELLTRFEVDDVEAARILAHLNAALHDAGISCWETKYRYGLARPSQIDPTISTPVGVPPFPAYTSGHATFSGAAAEVLGHFFPIEREHLRGLAEEAALSRVLGGIHYRFDGERGLEAGRQIGALAVKRAKLEE